MFMLPQQGEQRQGEREMDVLSHFSADHCQEKANLYIAGNFAMSF
jgi:hypothetical protein